jgi:hypothetical protein
MTIRPIDLRGLAAIAHNANQVRLAARPGYPRVANSDTRETATDLTLGALVAEATAADLAREAQQEARTVRDDDQIEESVMHDRLVTLRCAIAERMLAEAGYEDWEVSAAD